MQAFGEGATNVFEPVVGPGRGTRRTAFIAAFDTLLDEEGGGGGGDGAVDPRAEQIVAAAGEFMGLNNELMLSVKQSPWWEKYLWAGCALAVAGVGWGVHRYRSAPPSR